MALIKCPICGKDISDKAISCPHCGNDLSNQNKNTIKTDVKICTECGAEVAVGDEICKKCGCPVEQMDNGSNETKTADVPNKAKINIYKKKAFWIILIAALVAIFSGIAVYSLTRVPEDERTYDSAFINDLKKGLMDRWSTDPKIEDSENTYLNRLVDLELNAIGDYANKKFADSTLQEKAITYINLLKDQKDSLKYYTSDYTKYSELWENARLKRTQLIVSFINDYNLKFSSKYDDNLREIMDSSKVADENDEMKEKIETMKQSVNLNLVKDEHGYKYYETLIENTTGKDFRSFSVYIKLMDDQGVVIDTLIDYLEDFKAGQTSKAEFMTDKIFEKYDVNFEYYTE
ncbi:MAG: zinc ribbon domain-containing protein [Candidatus Ornithomonoglobus sp.]